MYSIWSLFSFLLLFCQNLLVGSEHLHHEHNQPEEELPSKTFGAESVDELLQQNDPLQVNLQKHFSWTDPALVAHLWGGPEKVPRSHLLGIPNHITGQSHRKERSLNKRVDFPDIPRERKQISTSRGLISKLVL